MDDEEENVKKYEPEETEEAPPSLGEIRMDSSGTTHISTGGGAWMPVPTTITSGTISSPTFASGGMISTVPTRVRSSKPPAAVLDAPPKRPRKLLVAFLGDDDEVQWCAKVNPDDISVDFDKDGAAPRMELGFWLIDAG